MTKELKYKLYKKMIRSLSTETLDELEKHSKALEAEQSEPHDEYYHERQQSHNCEINNNLPF